MQVSSALRRRDLERAVADQVLELERKVIESTTGDRRAASDASRRSRRDPHSADERLVRHLSSAVCLRDDDTGRHIERVSVTAAALADWCGFVVDPRRRSASPPRCTTSARSGSPTGCCSSRDGSRRTSERSSSGTANSVTHCSAARPARCSSLRPRSRSTTTSGGTAGDIRIAGAVMIFPSKRASPRLQTSSTRSRGTACIERRCPSTQPWTSWSAIAAGSSIRGLLDLFLDHLDDVLDLTRDAPGSRRALGSPRLVIAGDEPVLVEGLLRLMNRRGEMRVIGSGQTVD